jgi:tetratricopeptide (TPR) repeat protein
VLLDQKRTKRMVQVVAILTSLAFGGVILVVLGLIFFGGGSQSVADQALSDAKSAVQAAPNDPDALEQLASAYAGVNQLDKAVATQKRAVALQPDDISRVRTLVSLQSQAGDRAGAIATLQAYTARHPKAADAFFDLATLAEDAGRTDLARLSYQTFLRLAPDDSNAAAIKAKIKSLQ